MEEQNHKKLLYFLIIFSLLLNGIILIIILITDLAEKQWQELSLPKSAPVIFTDEAIPQNNQHIHSEEKPVIEQPKPQEVAALKPRASVFGATDTPQDIPEFTPGMTDVTTSDVFSKDTEPESPELLPENIEEPKKRDVSQESSDAEKSTDSLTQEVPGTTIAYSEHKANITEQKPSEKSSMQPKKPRTRRTRNNTGDGSKNASPIKKELTFSSLVDGFLHCIKNEGSDWIERKGNENIRPDIEEMKFISYMQKIAWYMQNAWRLDSLTLRNPIPRNSVIQVTLTLDKQGILQDLAVHTKTGIDEVDDRTIRGIRNASPYPPIPDHFHKDRIMVGFTIYFDPQTTYNHSFRIGIK